MKKKIMLLQKTFANSHMFMQADVGVSWLTEAVDVIVH